MNVLNYSILMFATQLVFIGCRTWNIKEIAKGNVRNVLLSGGIIHVAWLVSITIGSASMYEIVTAFKWEYSPIVLCSLIGSLIGSYVGLKGKKKK